MKFNRQGSFVRPQGARPNYLESALESPSLQKEALPHTFYPPKENETTNTLPQKKKKHPIPNPNKTHPNPAKPLKPETSKTTTKKKRIKPKKRTPRRKKKKLQPPQLSKALVSLDDLLVAVGLAGLQDLLVVDPGADL